MLSTLEAAATVETTSEPVTLGTFSTEEDGVTGSVGGGVVVGKMVLVGSCGVTATLESESVDTATTGDADVCIVTASEKDMEKAWVVEELTPARDETEVNIKGVETVMAVVLLPVPRTPVDTLVVEICSVNNWLGDSLVTVVRFPVTMGDVTSGTSTFEDDTASLETEVLVVWVAGGTLMNELVIRLLSEGETAGVVVKENSELACVEIVVVGNKLNVSVLAIMVKTSEGETAGPDEVELLTTEDDMDGVGMMEVSCIDTTDSAEKEALETEVVLANSKLLPVVETSGAWVDCVKWELTED